MQELTKEQFVADVACRLDNMPNTNIDSDDLPIILGEIEGYHKDGWTVTDVFRFMYASYEVNQIVPEEEALEIMCQVRAKYDSDPSLAPWR